MLLSRLHKRFLITSAAEDEGEEETDKPSGKTASLPYVAPDEPGTIHFRCDFHPDEMMGTITVE